MKLSEQADRGGHCRRPAGTQRVSKPVSASPPYRRPPVSLGHLSLRLAAVALRGGDNMLDGRQRGPDVLRDHRGPEAGLECSEDQPFLSRRHRGGPDWPIGFRTRGVRGSALCRPARRRWTARPIASAPPDFVGHRLCQPVELGIVQQAQGLAQVGWQGDPRFMGLPVETGVRGGRIRCLPAPVIRATPAMTFVWTPPGTQGPISV